MFNKKFTNLLFLATVLLVGCGDMRSSRTNKSSSKYSKNLQDSQNSSDKSQKSADRVFFSLNKYELISSHKDVLDSVADYLVSNPNSVVTLEGFCDGCGTPAYNLQLSLKRSESAAAYLIQKGINSNRVLTQGYGAKFMVPEGQEEVSIGLDAKMFYISDANRCVRALLQSKS